MIWHSWNDFWRMGGYGLFVWGSFGVTAAALVLEVLSARRTHHRLIHALRLQHSLDREPHP